MDKIESESIDSVITSPPYWQLRDYGYPEQWGLEPTYHEYLNHLWQMMDQVERILKPNGTVWVNLGDTYGGSKKGNTSNKGTYRRDKKAVMPNVNKSAKGPDKCLLLIPHRFAIGCIDRGWVMRNDIIWAKPNAMPESCTDRFSKKHEYFFFMVKNQKYYFDLDEIREQPKQSSQLRYQRAYNTYNGNKGFGFQNRSNDPTRKLGGKNPGSVSDFWQIVTKANKEKHYASFNFNLIEKPIIAGCPEDGIILDPFCGTGTTLVRALQLNRQIIVDR